MRQNKNRCSVAYLALTFIFMISMLFAFSITANAAVMYGDVTGDGRVNIKDATKVQLATAELQTLTDEEKLLADVDGDGRVNIKDVSFIQRYCANMITSFPVESQTPTTVPPTTQVSTDPDGWNNVVIKP